MKAPTVVLLLVGGWLCACGGSSSQVGEATSQPVESLEETLADPIAQLNAAARAGAVVEVMHGREVADPYRALEADSEATWAWVEAQNGRTLSYLASNADQERSQRLEELLTIGYYGELAAAGDLLFFTKREGDAEQPLLYATPTGGEPRVLVDPNTMGERIALDWFFPSPNGRYLAYGLSSGGDERSTLHILSVADGQALPDTIDHAKWASLAWLHDESGFYYTRYPRPGDLDYDAENEDTYFRHLYFHALGADPLDDPLVMRADRTDFVGAEVSEDDRWVSVVAYHSWSQSDLYLMDRTDAEPQLRPIVTGEDFLIYGGVAGDRLLLYSNEGHPRGRFLVTDPVEPGPRDSWTELIPEGEGTIEAGVHEGDYLLVSYVRDIAAQLVLYDLDGNLIADVPLPDRGSIGAFSLDGDTGRVAYAFTSYFYPPAVYVYEDGEQRELDRVAADITTDDYELEQVEVSSADGTPINVFLVHRRDWTRDGNNPVLLNGYGGFSVSMMPGFQRNVLYWLERGGVFAVANIRGGGEHGEAWHRDGMLANKPHTFEDFEAVIRWLSESGISSPNRIALTGASNGGLLMGAMLTRCPDAFRAAIASVGLYDMVRFTEFPPAEIWMGEYGDPSVAGDFEFLLGYSPYHNVTEGTAYPAAFIDTADQDTRVSWRHSTKFAARLQEATTSDRPILFFMQREMGHGAGTGVSDLVEQYVRYYTFIETELGL